MRHIDAIIIRIADLWRARHHHDFLGVQSVEDLEDALFQGSAAHNRVVDDDEVILIGRQRTVGDVIHMGGKVVALRAVRDESAQFDILPHHLLYPHVVIQPAHAVGHTVKSHLSCIGNIREHGMCHIAVDGPHDGWRELLTQPFALQIDVAVGTTTEIDALE